MTHDRTPASGPGRAAHTKQLPESRQVIWNATPFSGKLLTLIRPKKAGGQGYPGKEAPTAGAWPDQGDRLVPVRPQLSQSLHQKNHVPGPPGKQGWLVTTGLYHPQSLPRSRSSGGPSVKSSSTQAGQRECGKYTEERQDEPGLQVGLGDSLLRSKVTRATLQARGQ